MKTLNLLARPPHADAEAPPPCKGRVFRGLVNRYAADGVIRDDRRLTLLKRKSCAGCESCYGVDDMLAVSADYMPLDLSFVTQGSTYRLTWVGGGYCPYSGDYDDPEPVFVELDTNDEPLTASDGGEVKHPA